MEAISTIAFQNRFVEEFQGDESGDKLPRQTPGMLYSRVEPSAVADPALIAWSDEMGNELGLVRPRSDEEVNILGGNKVSSSMKPYAACYGGHQFGHWAGQLGDGRAITLGELPGATLPVWEIQLKGAGPTAYSRRADGRAVLRSSVREYLMSEAMYHLGVPTTRALSLVLTGDMVMRDMFYDGNPAYEPGAVVTRTAPSFLRFGNFEILAARREQDNLERLVNWTIKNYYPHLNGNDPLLPWFKEVVDRTAFLMSEWSRVGFVHGVMNTDNMSILGLTIDYGPYSFLDDYDLTFTPNTTDLPGRRYAFGQQAAVAKWNLGCLAGAISLLVPDTKDLVDILDQYDELYAQHFYRMMSNKIGLSKPDRELTGVFEKFLSVHKPDMTIFFQLLTEMPDRIISEEEVVGYFSECFYSDLSQEGRVQLTELLSTYRDRIAMDEMPQEERLALMRKSNPRFILRNYLLHQAIESLDKGDITLFDRLQQALKSPYSHNHDEFFARRPDWAMQQVGCSMLSCSS